MMTSRALQIPAHIGTDGPWRVKNRRIYRSDLDTVFKFLMLRHPRGASTPEIASLLAFTPGGRRQDRVCSLLRSWGLIRFDTENRLWFLRSRP